MSGEKRKCQSITIHTKAKILLRHLYENVKIGDHGREYNLADSTISTWKKNKEKIFQEAAEVGQDQKRKGQSPYLQVELAMLYWVRQMWSRVQPPPLTYHILKMKAKQYVINLLLFLFLCRFLNVKEIKINFFHSQCNYYL